MNLALSVFDLFAYALPGSLYLVLVGYVSARLQWFEPSDLAGVSTTVLVLALTIGAYLAGTIFGYVARLTTGWLPGWKPSQAEARREFLHRNAEIAPRAFVRMDTFTLLAGIRQNAIESATQIERVRAQGLMLCRSVPAVFGGALLAGCEVLAGDEQMMASVVGALLFASSYVALRQGRRFEYAALTATLEAAAWLPAVPSADDERRSFGTG